MKLNMVQLRFDLDSGIIVEEVISKESNSEEDDSEVESEE
jgi:hypothetical protein